MTTLSVEEAATRLCCIHFQKAQTLGTIWGADGQGRHTCHRSGLYSADREAVCSELQSRPSASNGSSGAAHVFRAHSQRERANGQRSARESTSCHTSTI